ncbi:MAG TPA: ABC transporter permease [Caldilineaceae bacterium]|nr:ABC transporter permease [Caldilineaceae bacterium]
MSELTLSPTLHQASMAQPAAARTLTQLTLRRFLRHRLAVLSIGVLALVVLSALFAPLSPYSPTEQNPKESLQPPSLAHWFGTDDLGRDVLTRTLYGGRISLSVGLLATALSLFLGVLIGALAGYAGGWADNILMRITDAFLTLPTLFVLILISTMLRDLPTLALRNSIVIVILVIAILQWMWPARLVRGEYLSLKERDFVTAARATGVGHRRVMGGHILPNTVGVIIVQGTLLVAFSIITESGLSYLGFGVQPPTPSWGNLLSTAQVYALRAPWLMVFPGMMIFITSMAVNYIGDGLRDAFDPFAKH